MQTLTNDDTAEIEKWESQLRVYQEGIKEYLKPSAITNMMKTRGIAVAVTAGMEDIDQAAFTMKRLQEVFNEFMGDKTIIGDEGRIDKAFESYGEDMPDITGSR